MCHPAQDTKAAGGLRNARIMTSVVETHFRPAQ